MQHTKCITVVIPTYNRLWALKQSIPFYLAQPEVAEILVIVDGCTDETAEWVQGVAQREPRVCCHVNGANVGACKARNLGAMIAKSDYLFFADDDMVLDPYNCLAVMLGELSRRDADIASCVLYRGSAVTVSARVSGILKVGDLVPCHRKKTLELIESVQLIKRLPAFSFAAALGTGIMLMKRNVFENVRYDEELGVTSYRDETDFQLKAYSAGYKTIVCPMVQLIDLPRQSDSGGCHRLSYFLYTLHACRNNWRVLKRHAKTLQDLGISYRIEYMQVAFFWEHFFCRFPRRLARDLVFRLGMGGALAILRGRKNGQ